MTKSGAKLLALAVIKAAIIDGDLSFIYSRRSDLYFDLAEIDRNQLMKKYDDECNLINKKRALPKESITLENYKNMLLKDIAEMLGITPSGLYSRLHRGMTIEEAVAMGGKKA